MNWKQKLVDFYYFWKFTSLVAELKQAGSRNPWMDAHDELRMRALLEELRDFASEKWRDYPTPDDVKQAWMDERIKPVASIYPLQHIKALKKAVEVMPVNELLHPDAFKEWNEHVDKIAAKYAGKPKYTELQKRVLRGV